jgi:hypothetical protein
LPRIRTIKPEAFDDEDLCALSPLHRWCYAGLWCQADKAGRLEDRPKRLKARVLPFDDVDMDSVLAELTRAGFIIRYLVAGKAYIAIKPSSWQKHQFIRSNESESGIPPPDDHAVVYASLGSDEGLGQALRRKDPENQALAEMVAKRRQEAPLIGKGKEGNGRERKERSSEPLTRSEPADDSPIVLTFPTVGPKGPTWELRQRQLDGWRGLYPGVEVLAEAQKALAWLQAHPGRRKTVGGMPAFLVNWFNRVTDRSRPFGAAGTTTKTAGNLGNLQRFVTRGEG